MTTTEKKKYMTLQEFNETCLQMDAILTGLGNEFADDDPRVEQLIRLSNTADEYYKELHADGYTDMGIQMENQVFVKIIRMARERNLCTNEFIVQSLETFVNQTKNTTKL